jgi:ABC-type Mn2+/Zn2+ transport system ATPase subunit
VRTTIDPDVAVAEAIVNDISTTVLDESGVTVDGDGKKKTLVEWVHSMRKAPKKSISEWRHRALDKTGFIW